MNNYDIDNWIVCILISLRDMANKVGRETIADRLDETILSVANDGKQLSAQETQRNRESVKHIAPSPGVRRVH